jgi:exocyst complex protein 7
MKNTPFPLLAEDRKARIGMINEYMGKYARSNGQVSPMIQLYADVRGPYLKSVLENLATASVSGARRADPDSIYRPGMNQISSYAKALEGALFAEHEIITNIPFSRNDASEVFKLTCQGAVAELARTIRDLNTFIKANLTTDCFLAFEIIQVMSELSSNTEEKTGNGELKPLFASALKPIRETGRSSLAELLGDIRQRVTSLPTIPADGAAVPLTTEVMTRLQVMVSFLRPVSSIMIAVGDNGWKNNTAPLVSADQVPTLNTFDVTADGKQIFAHYCIDTITTLLESLDRKAQPLAKNKSVLGVFMLNNVTIIDRMIRNSELQPLLQPRMSEIERWRKAAIKDYSGPWQDLSRQLMDVTYTRSTARPTSGSAPLVDSVAIVKALSSKEKEATKQKFTAFNNMFDELVAKHKALSMEREVKTMLARDVQGMIEMLYHRFWDRYHEIDKGKGKYVKYDKAQITATFASLEK